MKVLLASMQFGPGYSQGTERYLSILRGGLAARGHDALVLAGDPQSRSAPRPLGSPSADDPGLLMHEARGWMTVRGASPHRIASVLRGLRPDVVHLANPAHIGLGIVGASRALNIPLVVTIMDYWWLCPKHTLQHYRGGICDADVTALECLTCMAHSHERGWPRRISQWPGLRAVALPLLYFGKWTLAGLTPAESLRWTRRQRHTLAALDSADAVIFPSQAAASLLGPRIAHRRTRAIPYGLEAHWFAAPRAGPGARAGEPTERGDISLELAAPRALVLGYAGALAEHKGLHLLLEALARLGWRETRVRVAGSGGDAAYAAKLRRWGSGLRVEWLGAVAPSEMPRFLDSLDALVFPSAWPENLPIVVLEASARRVPVIAARVPGVAELITDPRQLFEPGSAEDLARTLARFAQSGRPPQIPQVSPAETMIEATLETYAAVAQANLS